MLTSTRYAKVDKKSLQSGDGSIDSG